jgi:hypothetical protein
VADPYGIHHAVADLDEIAEKHGDREFQEMTGDAPLRQIRSEFLYIHQ